MGRGAAGGAAAHHVLQRQDGQVSPLGHAPGPAPTPARPGAPGCFQGHLGMCPTDSLKDSGLKRCFRATLRGEVGSLDRGPGARSFWVRGFTIKAPLIKIMAVSIGTQPPAALPYQEVKRMGLKVPIVCNQYLAPQPTSPCLQVGDTVHLISIDP